MKKLLRISVFFMMGLSAAYVAADIACNQLRFCDGGGICLGAGSLDGCVITCTSSSVACLDNPPM